MRKILYTIRLAIIDAFEYRTDMFFYALNWAVTPLLLIFLWQAVSQSSSQIATLRQELVLYYTLMIIIQIWTAAWSAPFLARNIRLGRLSPYLLRPFPYLFDQIANNIGEKVVKTLFTLPIVLAILWYFHTPFPTLSGVQWFLFVLSWFCAGVIYFLFDTCMGLLGFWLEEIEAIRQFNYVLKDLLSGMLFPLFLLPTVLQNISHVLPYRYELSFPLEIILKKLSSTEIITGFIWQFFWLIVIIFLYSFLWKRGLVKYSANGN